jgi:hypothetical protein
MGYSSLPLPEAVSALQISPPQEAGARVAARQSLIPESASQAADRLRSARINPSAAKMTTKDTPVVTVPSA